MVPTNGGGEAASYQTKLDSCAVTSLDRDCLTKTPGYVGIANLLHVRVPEHQPT